MSYSTSSKSMDILFFINTKYTYKKTYLLNAYIGYLNSDTHTPNVGLVAH